MTVGHKSKIDEIPASRVMIRLLNMQKLRPEFKKHHRGRLIISAIFTTFLVFTNVSRGQAPEPVLQTGHSNAVTSVAFSPDNRILASVGNDGNTKLWDLERSAELRTLPGDSDLVRAISFSPSGNILASAGRDGTIKLWDIDSGREFMALRNSGAVSAAAFSPDGRRIATGSENNNVFLWELGSGRQLLQLDCQHLVTTFAFSPDGKMLYGGSRSGLTSWNVETGKPIKTFTQYVGESRSITIESSRKVLASVLFGDTSDIALNGNSRLQKIRFTLEASRAAESRVELWDIEKEKLICQIPGHEGSILSAVFSRDGKTLASGGADGTIKMWDVATCQAKASLFELSDSVYAISFSPDGKTLAAGSGDKTIKLWDIESGKLVNLLSRASNIITAALRPDGKLLAVSTWNRTIVFIDLESELISAPTEIQYPALSIGFSPNGRTLAVKTIDDEIFLLEIDSKNKTPVKELPDWLAAALNNQKVIIEHGGKRIRLRDANQKTLAEFLIFQSDDWVILDSGKFFYGSQIGQARLLWRFTENLFDVAPVDAFYYEYYYPGLLKKILAGDSRQLPRDIKAIDRKDIRQANVFICRKCPCSPEIQFSAPEEIVAQAESNICIDILASPEFAPTDFIDFNALAESLVDNSEPVTRKIFSNFLAGNIINNQKTLQDYVRLVKANPEQKPDNSLVQMMRREFNGLLRQKDFFNEYKGLIKSISPTTRALSLAKPKGNELAWLNRMLLEDAFPKILKRGKVHNLESSNNGGQKSSAAEAETKTDHWGKCSENEMCLQDMRLFWNGRLIQRWRGDIITAKNCKNAGRYRIQCQTKVPIVNGIKNHYSAYLFNQDRVKSKDGELIFR